MLVQEIIVAKRDGEELSREAIEQFVRGLTNGEVAAEQASALAMAIFLRGMSFEETAALTRAMAASGVLIDWSCERLGGPVIDKHSTGGVGDKVSLKLAPIAAACGLFVPMISGRGLGHTGGTLDKMGAIPGYQATPELQLFKRVVREVGCAIIGQTGDLAPADGRLYAIRDVTATVESIPLITASILSKKLAAGLDGLVMDVKVGSGAFMADEVRATALAQSLIETGAAAGLRVSALITDMDEPLGRTAGNALEVYETIDYLTGVHRDPRLDECVRALAVEMLRLSGVADSAGGADQRVEAALASGRAAEVFARMVAALGGPADLLERPQAYLARAPVTAPATPRETGWVARVDTRAVGLAIIELGGGRARVEDDIDPGVGISDFVAVGDQVDPGRPLAVVHANSQADAERAVARLRAAYVISDAPVVTTPVVRRRMAAVG